MMRASALRRARAGWVLLAVVAQAAAPVPARAERTTGSAGGAIVPIRGVIDDIMRDSVARRVNTARDQGATTIILEFDTPGGVVTSALDICRFLKSLPAGTRTVAWVHPNAYSAGAMIALACNEIWMSSASAIGDAAPIAIGPGGPVELKDTERAKAESPVLQEFRDSAVRNGYDPLLARAMVTLGAEVWWIENPATDERRFVTPEEKAQKIDNVAADERTWRLVERYTVRTASGAEKTFPVVQPVDSRSELLTLSQYDAVAFGLAKGVVADLGELSAELGLAGTLQRLEISGWEKFAAWLNSPLIRGILLIIVMLGAYLEFHTPGAIVPGLAALIALVIFLAAPYAAGLASIWVFVLVGLGLVLLALEIFVLPGFGVAGVAGVALLLVAVIASFVPSEPGKLPFSWPELPGTWGAVVTGFKVLTGSTLISLLGMLLLAHFLPRSRLATGLVSDNPDGTQWVPADPYADVALVGDVGLVTGDLRPGGQARFGHTVVDVQSQGEYVEAGRRVQVIRREGMNVIVRPLPDPVA